MEGIGNMAHVIDIVSSAAAAEDSEPSPPSHNVEGGSIVVASTVETPKPSQTATSKGEDDAGGDERTDEPEGAGSTDPMQSSSNDKYTVVVHTDSSIEYDCPSKVGSWNHSNVLTGSLTASMTDGPGCFVKFTFTGDAVTMYGATGPRAGVFGCSTSSDVWTAVGWWNAWGGSNFFRSYQGSCTIAGLGYGKHTITMTNSPHNPRGMYFTGLRYSTNKTAVTYAAPEWNACCAAYSFPEGATTTISPGSGASATAGSSAGAGSGAFGNYDWKTITAISLSLLGIVGLASLLIGCMCCRKRDKGYGDDPLAEISEAPELEPLRRRRRPFDSKKTHRRLRSKRRPPPPSPSDTCTSDSCTSTDEEKQVRKSR